MVSNDAAIVHRSRVRRPNSVSPTQVMHSQRPGVSAVYGLFDDQHGSGSWLFNLLRREPRTDATTARLWPGQQWTYVGGMLDGQLDGWQSTGDDVDVSVSSQAPQVLRLQCTDHVSGCPH